MKALVGLVVAMGVLIVVGVAVVAVTIMHRMGTAGGSGSAPALAAEATLNEPIGTRIGGISAMNDRLAVLLQGGGADRVVFVDAHGHVVGRLSLQP
jgi:hypothetical protein